jgi:hypothetical protein
MHERHTAFAGFADSPTSWNQLTSSPLRQQAPRFIQLNSFGNEVVISNPSFQETCATASSVGGL